MVCDRLGTLSQGLSQNLVTSSHLHPRSVSEGFAPICDKCDKILITQHTPPVRRKVYRSTFRLQAYLKDYREDRNMVFLSVHKAVVDRLYHQDPRITSWRAWWHQGSGTPYLERNGQFIFPIGTPPSIQASIKHDH